MKKKPVTVMDLLRKKINKDLRILRKVVKRRMNRDKIDGRN